MLVATSTHIVTATYTNSDENFGSSGPASLTQTVNPAPTISAVTVTPSSRQYSDPMTFTATLTPDMINGVNPATSVTFFIGTQQITGAPTLVDSGGVLTWTLSNVPLLEPAPFGTSPTGQMAPGNHNVTAMFGGSNPNFLVGAPSTTLTITPEDARVTYTGPLYVGTATSTSTTATVTLSATILDISNSTLTADPVYDPYAGDIRNAQVQFFYLNSTGGQVIINSTLLSPALINPSDTTAGTVLYNWTTPAISPCQSPCSQTFTVGIIINNYYSRNSPDEDTIITVAQPGTNFITLGGFLNMTNSVGEVPGTTGTKTNFGGNIKYNKSGSNLQGQLNIIVRSTVLAPGDTCAAGADGFHVYQIKSNSLTSLGVNFPNGPSSYPGLATVVSKANVQDVTNPATTCSVGGNATLQMDMTDNGTGGQTDTLGITIWDGSTNLWYSSYWNGTKTVQQVLASPTGGGNVSVH